MSFDNWLSTDTASDFADHREDGEDPEDAVEPPDTVRDLDTVWDLDLSIDVDENPYAEGDDFSECLADWLADQDDADGRTALLLLANAVA